VRRVVVFLAAVARVVVFRVAVAFRRVEEVLGAMSMSFLIAEAGVNRTLVLAALFTGLPVWIRPGVAPSFGGGHIPHLPEVKNT